MSKNTSKAKGKRVKLSLEAKYLLSTLGRIGGQTRAEKLSPEERRASAIKASQAAAKARSEKAAERQRNMK